MWPVVETCWDAAQTWTNLYRRCHLQVSWWRVPYNTDRIRPVRRRRHRRPRRRPILPVQSYLRHRSDAIAYRQETIREVGMDQSSRTTQRVCMFQRSYLYRAHLLCFGRWYQWDGGVLFELSDRYQRKSFSLTGAKVWNGIWRNSTETRPRLGRIQRRRRKRTWRKETSPVPVETTVGTLPTRTPRG